MVVNIIHVFKGKATPPGILILNFLPLIETE